MGNMDHINDPNEFNGDYYFYVSKETTVTVEDNVLTQSDLDREPILSVTLELLTADGRAITTADDTLYTVESEVE